MELLGIAVIRMPVKHLSVIHQKPSSQLLPCVASGQKCHGVPFCRVTGFAETIQAQS